MENAGLRGLKVTVSPSASYRHFINVFLRSWYVNWGYPIHHWNLWQVTKETECVVPSVLAEKKMLRMLRVLRAAWHFSRSPWLSCTSFWIRTCSTRQLFFLVLFFFFLSLCLRMCSLSFSNLNKPVSLSLHFASRLFTFLYSVFLAGWPGVRLPASSSPPCAFNGGPDASYSVLSNSFQVWACEVCTADRQFLAPRLSSFPLAYCVNQPSFQLCQHLDCTGLETAVSWVQAVEQSGVLETRMILLFPPRK